MESGLFMTKMDVVLLAILAAGTLFAVRSGLVTLSFNNTKYNRIIGDLTRKVKKLESLAEQEEQRAIEFLKAHALSSVLAEQARKTAANISKLFD